MLCYRPPSFEKKGVYLPYLAHNSQNSIKEGVINLTTIGQNDSGPMKMKLKNWLLLVFCFTEHNKSYAQTTHEASLPRKGYDDRTLSERTINRWYRFVRTLCKIEFTYQSQKNPNFKVVLEWQKWLKTPKVIYIFMAYNVISCKKSRDTLEKSKSQILLVY